MAWVAGMTMQRTPGATTRPLRTAAAACRSEMRQLVQKALDVMDSNLHDYDHVDLDAAYAAEHAINACRNRLRKQHLDALKLGVYDYAIGNAYSSLYALYEKMGDYVINVSEAIDGSRKHTED